MHWIFVILLPFVLFAEDLPKKVLCLTVPKAGTHLLIKAIETITGKPPCWIGQKDANELDLLQDSDSSERVYISHLFSSMDRIEEFDPDKIVKILLIRDPRDVMVSFQHYLAKGKKWPFGSKYDQYRLYKKSKDDQLSYVLNYSAMSPKDSLLLAADLCRDPNLIVIRFEDLVGEKGGGSVESQRKTLDQLTQVLGYPCTPSELDKISSKIFGGTATFREGKIGSWQSAYSQENGALFKKILGQATLDLGYAEDLNW